MLPVDIYSQAHLFVASIRVFEHLHGQPPSLKGLSELLHVSEEELSRVSRRLEDSGIIGIIRSGGDIRFSILDHTKIEAFPRSQEAPGIEEELTKFKSKHESRLKELEESLAKKGDRSSIFSELDKALKDPSLMKKKNPLD
jgi:DNA-binding Lrp family transcriptional regulator